MEKISQQIPQNEAVIKIAGVHDFSGFLKASDLNKALESNPSMNLSMAVEADIEGNIEQSTQDTELDAQNQAPLDEPLANSTVLDPAEEPDEPAMVGETGTAAEFEQVDGPNVNPTVLDKRERQRIRKRLARQRRALTRNLAKLSTNPNGQGNQGSGASGNRNEGAGPSNPQTPGSVKPRVKRGRDSPGVTKTEVKRARQEQARPGQSSFVEATRKGLVLTITPLDSDGNLIRAIEADRLIIMKEIEQYISLNRPNINITGCSLRGDSLIIRCLNQKTLETVKGVVSPLRDPRSNLQGYQCLGPGDSPPLTVYGVWVEKPVPTRVMLLKLLRDANNWLNLKTMVVKAEISKEKGSTFLVGVEPEIRTELGKRNFQLHYGVGRTAHFRPKSKGQSRGGDQAP